jgi:hypothetical protein
VAAGGHAVSTFEFRPQPKPGSERVTKRGTTLRPAPNPNTPARDRVYAFVKSQPCLACGAAGPSEAAHIHAIASLKVKGQAIRRGHKGLAALAAIPLCQPCHTGPAGIHSMREDKWLDKRIAGGRAAALEFVALSLAQALEEVAA